MHDVAVLALDRVIPFDLGIACEVFGRVRGPDGAPAYRVRVCGVRRRVEAGAFHLVAPYGLEALAAADTVLVPGVEDVDAPTPAAVLTALRRTWARGARLASICTGAFVLAAAGLLDGRRATTHWLAAACLAERHPAIAVEPDVLFVDEGRIITSAGAAAGLDMCLHLVARDHGQAAATEAARLAVAPLFRDGGQAQFIRPEPPGSAADLAPVLDWVLAHLGERLDVPAMARRAGMGERTFVRRFRGQVGTTPLQWLLAARIRRAQELLETTALLAEQVGQMTGFESPVTFRARFKRIVGLSPAAYRRRFGAPAVTSRPPAVEHWNAA